jgi:hypothetical protein
MGTYAGNGVGFGDRGSFSTDIDATGPVTRDGRVLYRALATICKVQITLAGDRNHALWKAFEADYQGAMRATFTVSPGVDSPPGWSIDVERA